MPFDARLRHSRCDGWLLGACISLSTPPCHGATHPIPLPRTGGASPFPSKSRTAGAPSSLLWRVALPQNARTPEHRWKLEACASGRDHRPHPSHPSALSRRDPDRSSGMMRSAHESRMFERNWPRREPLRMFPVCLGLFVCRGGGSRGERFDTEENKICLSGLAL